MKNRVIKACAVAGLLTAAATAQLSAQVVSDGQSQQFKINEKQYNITTEGYNAKITESTFGYNCKPAPLPEATRYAMGVHVGMDIGGAVPWPPSNLSSGEMKMSAVPKLNPSLGVSFTAPLSKRFTLTAEATYKQVGIDADAWVSGQKFRIPNPDGEDLLTQFRGTANVVMDFTMIEVPVYIGFGFRGGRDRMYLGAYYSYVFDSHFNTTPLKGLVENPNNPSEPPIMITPDNPVPSDVMPVFDNYLGNWDAGVLFGYEWQIVPRIKMTARFSMGFKDIFRNGSNYLEYKMLHMRGTVAVSYSFLKYKK